MTTTNKEPVLVVLQMTGGNDYLNTVIPYMDGMYYDYRPTVGVAEEDVIPIDSTVGLHPEMRPFKDAYDEGDLAIIHGVGYANSPRSHFRSMDIWHTCEPDTLGTEGWLGKVIRELDPNKENVVTAVSMGPSMFRALSVPGVPVACVDNLDSYGLMTNVEEARQRERLLERYKRLYGPAVGSGPVMDFLGQTGLDALAGADILKIAPQRYESSVEYAETSIGRKLRSIAQIHMADLGTRVFYVDQGSYDSHSNQAGMHDKLLADMSRGVQDFFDDLRHTTRRTTSSCSSSPSSVAARTTTAPAPTTALPARSSCSATPSRADSTARTRPSSSRTSSRATPSPTSTSAASTAPSSKTGFASTPSPSWEGRSRSLGF